MSADALLFPDPPLRLPLHVLLVDDGDADRELAREVFGAHDGQVVIDTCSSGQRALEFLHTPDTTPPDVILLDLNMPGMSGFDVLAALKADARLQFIPVVIMSSSSHARDIQEAYSLHASSYMTKQLDFAHFVQQIDAFVSFWMHVRTTHAPT